MIRDKAIAGRLVQGLRTKFFPKSRINQGLISIAPWVNIVLLIAMFMMLSNRLVVQASYQVDLPAGGVQGGAAPGLVAVVRYFPAAGVFEAGERFFFEDESFLLGNERQLRMLRSSLTAALVRGGDQSLLLYADRRVSNETLIGIYDVLRDAGFTSVSIAVLSK